MKISPSLDLRQTQRLSMTPQLRQALELLHMNQQDLMQTLREALDKNPLLQVDEDMAEPVLAPHIPQSQHRAESHFDVDALPAAPTSLGAHLIAQLGMTQAPDAAIALAKFLALELESDGYLRVPLDDIAARLGVRPSDCEIALRLLQTCEPSGVAARDLGECLAIQLAEQGLLTPPIRAILTRLDLVAADDHVALAALTGLEGDALAAALTALRLLNPRPGAGFEPDQSPVVIPEIIVRRDTFGQWRCELNPDVMPKISINTAYARMLGQADPQATPWLEQANWLLRALSQRAANIQKVSEAIVEHQVRFFEYGPLEMRALSLREIAEKTKLHESTISRTVNGKYLTCRAGTFELRYFFTASLNATVGDERFGASAIRARIKRLIDEESHNNPLSDDDLVNNLRKGGVDIARRTIAKYRALMGINSSVQRRQQYDSAQRMNS